MLGKFSAGDILRYCSYFSWKIGFGIFSNLHEMSKPISLEIKRININLYNTSHNSKITRHSSKLTSHNSKLSHVFSLKSKLHFLLLSSDLTSWFLTFNHNFWLPTSYFRLLNFYFKFQLSMWWTRHLECCRNHCVGNNIISSSIGKVLIYSKYN